jgi:hypothetical protein
MTRQDSAAARFLPALALPALAWLMASSLALAQVPQAPAGAQLTPPPLPPPQLSGRWELNVQASDPAPSETAARGEGTEDRRGGGGGMGGRGGGMGRRGGMSGRSGMGGGEAAKPEESAAARQEMERVIEAPRFLIIVQHEADLNLTDDQGHVTVLKPDGVKVSEQQAGASIDRTTKWDDRSLVTTTKLSNGVKVTQTYTKISEGLQLVVTTRIEGGRRPNPVEFKRVYDQALQ